VVYLACLVAQYPDQTNVATLSELVRSVTALNVETQSVTVQNVTVQSVTVQNAMVQIWAPLNVGIQNGSVQNAVTPNAMDVPVVRSYPGATASMVAHFVVHFAATRTAMVPNARAPNVMVQISAILNVGLQSDSAQSAVTPNAMDVPVVRNYRAATDALAVHYAVTHFAMGFRFVGTALRYAVELLPPGVVHFFAVAVQTLGEVIRLAQVVPVQFVHDCALASHPNPSLYLDQCVSDDLHPRLARTV
jgi:hypothetical protein